MTLKFKRIIIFAVSLVLMATVVCSSVIPARAWTDFTQSVTNDFRGTIEKTTVTLNKYEMDPDGNIINHPVANAQFKLIRIEGDGTETVIMNTADNSDIFVTSLSGKITVEKLNSGDYKFVEIKPAYGYTFDKNSSGADITEYYFTISADDAMGAAIVSVDAYNRRQRSGLEVSKTVVSEGKDEPDAELLDDKFEFTISFSDGQDYKYKIVPGDNKLHSTENGRFFLKHGEKAVFDNLPVGIFYQVYETYNASFFTQSRDNTGSIQLDTLAKAEFTNTHTKTDVEKGNLEIEKTVSGEEADTEELFSFRVTFSRPGTYQYKINGEEPPIDFVSGETLQLKHSQKAIFTELPVGLSYTVEEISAGQNGYTATVSNFSGKIIPEGVICAVENHKGENEPGSLAIKKTVSGTGADKEHKFSFTVTFTGEEALDKPFAYTTDKGGAGIIINTGTIKLAHDETAVFADIPYGVQWKVSEDNAQADGYIPSSTEQSGAIPSSCRAYAYFNNHKEDGKPEEKETIITVEKRVEGEIPDSEIDREFWFTFVKNDEEPVRFSLKPSDPERSSKSFILKENDTYSITEDDPFKYGYIQTAAVNASGSANEQEIMVTLTNTYIGTVWKTIQGEKLWNLKGQSESLKPASITVELLANNVVVQNATVIPDENGKWLYSFLAPKYDADGDEISYTIREIPVPGFISKVVENNIVNTFIKPVISSPITVKKTITGNRPDKDDTFTFKLTALKNAPMPSASSAGSMTINITGEGEKNFGDIKYENAGTYTYTVSELKGSGKCIYDDTVYTVTVTVEQSEDALAVTSVKYEKLGKPIEDNKAVFVNDYENPYETQVSVKKVWEGGTNSLQPDEVKVQLFKDNIAMGDTVTLNEQNGWKYTWQGLEKSAAWTVDEVEVPEGYTKTVSGDMENGFVITNTFNEPKDDEILISGSKTWYHGDNPITNRPGEITVYIKDGSQIVARATINEDDHWQWTFKLPKYRDDGKTPIEYTVDEDAIGGYTKSVNGFNITNSHNSAKPENITIDGKKIWNYGAAPQNDRPQSVTVYIKNGDKTVKKFEVTAAENWQWSVQLPKTDDNGNIIRYSVTEGNVPHYKHQVDGFDLINTYESASYPGDFPKTVDNSNLYLWIIISLLSAAAFVCVTILRRRHRYTGKYYYSPNH